MALNKINFTLDLLNNSKRTQYLTRLQTTPQVLSGYTVASHQHQCAMLYITLATVTQSKVNSNILIALLTHDNMETFTGDLLAPAKNTFPDTWDEIEIKIQNDFISSLALNKEDRTIVSAVTATLFPTERDMEDALEYCSRLFVKLIDLGELLLRCADEYESGNNNVRIHTCINNCLSWFRETSKELSKYAENSDYFDDLLKSAELLNSVLIFRLRDIGLTID